MDSQLRELDIKRRSTEGSLANASSVVVLMPDSSLSGSGGSPFVGVSVRRWTGHGTAPRDCNYAGRRAL